MAQQTDKITKTNEFIPAKPDFSGDGVAVWHKTDKNGKAYLTIKILGSIIVNAFLPKEEEMVK